MVLEEKVDQNLRSGAQPTAMEINQIAPARISRLKADPSFPTLVGGCSDKTGGAWSPIMGNGLQLLFKRVKGFAGSGAV